MIVIPGLVSATCNILRLGPSEPLLESPSGDDPLSSGRLRQRRRWQRQHLALLIRVAAVDSYDRTLIAGGSVGSRLLAGAPDRAFPFPVTVPMGCWRRGCGVLSWLRCWVIGWGHEAPVADSIRLGLWVEIAAVPVSSFCFEGEQTDSANHCLMLLKPDREEGAPRKQKTCFPHWFLPLYTVYCLMGLGKIWNLTRITTTSVLHLKGVIFSIPWMS